MEQDITTQSLVKSIQNIYEASQIQNQNLMDLKEINRPYDREAHQTQLKLQELLIGYSLSNADNIYDEDDYTDILDRGVASNIEVPVDDSYPTINESDTDIVEEEIPDESCQSLPEDEINLQQQQQEEEKEEEEYISDYERGYRDGYADGYGDRPVVTQEQEAETVKENPISEDILLQDIDTEDVPEEELLSQEDEEEEIVVEEEEDDLSVLQQNTATVNLQKGDVTDEDEVYRL